MPPTLPSQRRSGHRSPSPPPRDAAETPSARRRDAGVRVGGEPLRADPQARPSSESLHLDTPVYIPPKWTPDSAQGIFSAFFSIQPHPIRNPLLLRWFLQQSRQTCPIKKANPPGVIILITSALPLPIATLELDARHSVRRPFRGSGEHFAYKYGNHRISKGRHLRLNELVLQSKRSTPRPTAAPAPVAYITVPTLEVGKALSHHLVTSRPGFDPVVGGPPSSAWGSQTNPPRPFPWTLPPAGGLRQHRPRGPLRLRVAGQGRGGARAAARGAPIRGTTLAKKGVYFFPPEFHPPLSAICAAENPGILSLSYVCLFLRRLSTTGFSRVFFIITIRSIFGTSLFQTLFSVYNHSSPMPVVSPRCCAQVKTRQEHLEAIAAVLKDKAGRRRGGRPNPQKRLNE